MDVQRECSCRRETAWMHYVPVFIKQFGGEPNPVNSVLSKLDDGADHCIIYILFP